MTDSFPPFPNAGYGGCNPHNVLSLDIEYLTDQADGIVLFFPPEDPKGHIVCISAVSWTFGTSEKTSVVFALTPDEDEDLTSVQVRHAETDDELTVKFYKVF